MSVLPASPEELLISIRSFVKGSHARSGHKLSSEEHARCALHLLRTLPAARTAVLEHLCHVFDESVNSYLFELEGEASTGLNLDGVIQEINDVLLNFINSNAAAWSPLISAWSIDLLGQISSTYAGRRGVPHPSSLNELLQLWMTCKATRTLMDVASQCFAAMVGTCPDLCVDALLDTSVQHSPHFDWVVAHIGSCFPNTIITRVLCCGLKDFCNSQSQGLVAPDKKVPKMASVVGILGHLASQHSQDIRKALLELFQESLESDEEQHLFTVPFLLQLATMSPMLLRVITTDFVQALTPDVLNRLSEQFLKSSLLLQDKDSLLTLVIHLICSSGSGAFKLLRFLLDRACDGGQQSGVNLHVQKTCALILDLLVLDLQRSVYSQSDNLSLAQQAGASSVPETTEIPFLTELQKHTNTLCTDILTAGDQRLPWLQRLLGLIGVHCGESCATDILTCILIEQSAVSKVCLFTSLQAEIEAAFPNILPRTLNKTMNQLQRLQESETNQLLVNLTELLKWETVGKGRDTPRSSFRAALLPHLHPLSTQLHHARLAVATQTLELLHLIGRPDPVTMVTLVGVAQSTAEFFFTAMHISRDNSKKQKILDQCQSYLSSWCQLPMGQQLILRTLLEGVTNKQNCYLFDGRPRIEGEGAPLRDKPTSLLRENQKFANASFTLPASSSAVFHAGTIGRGLKPRTDQAVTSKEEILANCQYFLDTLHLCCSGRDPSPPSPVVSLQPVDEKAAKTLATLLVELACPDVTHTGVAWPEEEHMKLTVERDLFVRRRFEENPLFWNFLEMISRVPTALCQCAVLLYSLHATLIAFWDTSRATKGENAPSQLRATCRLLECMKQSGCLPPPLCYCSLLIPSLAPSEINLLLTTIWAFLKENPPSFNTPLSKPDLSGKYISSFPPGVTLRYAEVIHAIVHKNIGQFGDLYSQLFPSLVPVTPLQGTSAVPVVAVGSPSQGQLPVQSSGAPS
ncbi:integrator complex subunit 5-like [Acanthaster planci]|uniref:Integrator complex subunit 5-like n=1 Tax=Acanthaster planci TaxID=133434 RepID=A0A8B7XX23_ACAPL|nr:integrator complex subunit 5-like [Acanthaster planci]